MAYVQQKNKRWYFRLVLPEDVRPHFKNLKEITKTLGAASKREAEKLASPLIAEWDTKIKGARAANARETVFTLGPLRVKRSANSFDLETEDGTPISSHSLREGLFREVARDWFEHHWRAHFDAAAKSHYTEHEVKERVDQTTVRAGINSHFEIYRAILPSLPRFIQACVGLINRNMKYQSNNLDWKALFPESKNLPNTDDFDYYQEETLLKGTTISDAIKEYFGRAHDVRPKTEQLWRARIGIFQEWLGDDVRLTHLTPTKAEEFRKALLEFPARRPAAVKGFDASIAWAVEKKAKRLTGQTVNAYTNAIRAILYPACKRLSIRNPFAELGAIKGKPRSETKYLDFADEEIKAIFGKNFCLDGRGKYAEPSDYWIMLGLILHGGRINEWAQARKDQFLVENGVFIFKVSGTLKTEASARAVPIHSAMLTLGFRDFWEKARPGRLFTDLTETEEGQFAAALSKRCNRAIDRAGVNAKRKVVHSFRHTWITKARDADVEKQWTDIIAGHETEGQGPKYGSYSLRMAKEKLERVRFDLDMTHLAEVWQNIQLAQKRTARLKNAIKRGVAGALADR
ncbi:MAG: hypothetical protein QHC89_08735 [Bosea sp. (in: a-proteobacteria)]|nr:hypothetical protein [Bosea sp. (in: a-proteobacteria)]